MREYSPTYAEKHAAETPKLLTNWTDAVLKDFSLSLGIASGSGATMKSDFLAGSGDGGSDVKKSMGTHMGLLREWCLSHLLHRALVDAYGTSPDITKSKNKQARVIITKCRKVIESLNKSGDLLQLFNETQLETVSQAIKLKNAPQHIWGSYDAVFCGLLNKWDNLKQSYRHTNRSLPIESDKVLIHEFYSLLNAVRQVQVLAQKSMQFVAMEAYFELCILYLNVLAEHSALVMKNIGHTVNSALMQPPPQQERKLSDALHPQTRAVRTLLRSGLNERFFNRYHPLAALQNWRHVYGSRATADLENEVDLTWFKYDYVFELMLALFPKTSNLKMVQRLCEEVDFTAADSRIPVSVTLSIR